MEIAGGMFSGEGWGGLQRLGWSSTWFSVNFGDFCNYMSEGDKSRGKKNTRQKTPQASGRKFTVEVCTMLLGRWIMEVFPFQLQLLTGSVPDWICLPFWYVLPHYQLKKICQSSTRATFWEKPQLPAISWPPNNFPQEMSRDARRRFGQPRTGR